MNLYRHCLGCGDPIEEDGDTICASCRKEWEAELDIASSIEEELHLIQIINDDQPFDTYWEVLR